MGFAKMVVLQNLGNSDLHGVANNSFSKGDPSSQRNAFSSSLSISDLLVWLKGLALDPCIPTTSSSLVQKLWSRALKLRKLLNWTAAERPERKRKLQEFLSSGKLIVASGLVSKRINHQTVKRLDTKLFSFQNSIHTTKYYNMPTTTYSCNLDNVLALEDRCQARQWDSNYGSLNKTRKRCRSNCEASLVDLDESVNSASLLSSANVFAMDASIIDSNNSYQSLNSSSSEEKPKRVVRFLKTQCKSRPVIPVGPNFQAKVPDWKVLANQGNICRDVDTGNAKWLGIRVWPLGGKSTKTTNKVGKGRPDSCPCVCRGSAECIKRHLLEARLHLRFNLGPAFFSWKFDEMGELVSKSWTSEEQRNFGALMKIDPFSNEGGFLELALNHIPSKCQKNILSYYYNVFIPRRLSQSTIYCFEVDSDEDQVDDNEEQGRQWRCGANHF